jgi:hypothetical protein
VSPDGIPNLSPKGTIRVWDDQSLFFLDIASPNTRSNLRLNPWIELNVVDTLSRRGYRFLGRATLHTGDEVHRRAVDRIASEEGVRYDADGVVLIRVHRALPLWSPGYDHIDGELAMRALWRTRRQELDAEFESHITRHGEFVVRDAADPSVER